MKHIMQCEIFDNVTLYVLCKIELLCVTYYILSRNLPSMKKIKKVIAQDIVPNKELLHV